MNTTAQLNPWVSANSSLLVLFMSITAITAILHKRDRGEFDPLAPVLLWGQVLSKSIDLSQIFFPCCNKSVYISGSCQQISSLNCSSFGEASLQLFGDTSVTVLPLIAGVRSSDKAPLLGGQSAATPPTALHNAQQVLASSARRQIFHAYDYNLSSPRDCRKKQMSPEQV